MKRVTVKRVTIVAILVVAALTGCQSKQHVSPQASAQVNADEARVQAIVKRCAVHATFITKSGRKAFYACIAPPGEQKQVEACAQKKLAIDGVLTRAARQKFLTDLNACVPR